MSGNQLGNSSLPKSQSFGGRADLTSWSGEKFIARLEPTPVCNRSALELNSQDKALFLEEWDLRNGQLTDQQIHLAICLGHL